MGDRCGVETIKKCHKSALSQCYLIRDKRANLTHNQAMYNAQSCSTEVAGMIIVKGETGQNGAVNAIFTQKWLLRNQEKHLQKLWNGDFQGGSSSSEIKTVSRGGGRQAMREVRCPY